MKTEQSQRFPAKRTIPVSAVGLTRDGDTPRLILPLLAATIWPAYSPPPLAADVLRVRFARHILARVPAAESVAFSSNQMEVPAPWRS